MPEEIVDTRDEKVSDVVLPQKEKDPLKKFLSFFPIKETIISFFRSLFSKFKKPSPKKFFKRKKKEKVEEMDEIV